MKRKILVIYYSQSGQLRDILDNILYDVQHKVEIDVAEIKPMQPFPFPWKVNSFFDAMPECVELVPSPIQPISEHILNKDYDLVLLGYQPWFLSPSQPVTSFLKSSYASVLMGKPVITVIGCRNMWLNAQERMKEMLQAVGANLVGNIVLTDSHPNLVSTLTVMRWAFKGQKEASGILPEAGVQSADIKNTQRFGTPIYNHLQDGRLDTLHKELLMQGAIHLKPGLIILEKRGITNFRKFARYIREKGGPGSPERQGRVKLFQRLLVTGIFVLSPISSLTAKLQLQLQKQGLLKDVQYFKSLRYEPGKL
jgi:hypothetical protein